MLRRIGLLMLTLALSGCGTMADPTRWFGSSPSVEPPSELVELDNRIEPREIWSRDIGEGNDGKRLGLAPTIQEGRVYVADSAGLVMALDAKDGKVQWSVDTELPIAGGPGAGDRLVLLGTSDAQLVALDEETGAERWRFPVSSEVLSSPAADLGTAVVHTNDGHVYGVDSAFGQQKWRYDHQVPVLTLRGSSAPVIANGTVYIGQAGGKLVALELDTGKPVWDVTITVPGGRSELSRIVDIDGDPLVSSGLVYAASYQGDVVAVGSATGSLVWRHKLSSYNDLAANWRYVFATDENGVVWALDGDTGAVRWKQEKLKRRQLSAPAVLDDYVVVGDFEGYLHWLSADTGELVARTRVGSAPITAPPRVVGDTLYVYGDKGELAAIRLPEPKS